MLYYMRSEYRGSVSRIGVRGGWGWWGGGGGGGSVGLEILQPDKRRGGPILPPSPVRLDCSWWIVIVDAVSAIAFDNMTVVFSESAETRPLTQPRAKS